MSSRVSYLSTTGLIRSSSSASVAHSTRAPADGTKSVLKALRLHARTPNDSDQVGEKVQPRRLCNDSGIVPLSPLFLVGIAIVISLCFIGAISCAFIGGEDEAIFKDLLDKIAEQSPGILLIGDDVDVDIDEPAVTIRWSILACGTNFTLPGSEGTHGSSSCGIPSMALWIYVDGEETPAAVYDPTQLPFTSGSTERLRIQNLHQFDTNHVLDVHEARLYPFDTYRLTSTIRAIASTTNESLPIVRIPLITETSSFIISSSDTASYVIPSTSNGTQYPSRDLDMVIHRPGEAKFFALMMFGANWMVAHATLALVALAWRSKDTKHVLEYLAFSVISMLVIPQIRNTMPDAPGFDGILIDQIGFFAQMLLSSIAAITLLVTLARRELAQFEAAEPVQEFAKEHPAPISKGLHKLRSGSSTSVDFRHIRNLSRTLSGRTPPSPIQERVETSPFSDYNSVASTSRFAPQKAGVNTGSHRKPSCLTTTIAMPVGIEAWITQIPPVTRTWLALSVLTSVAVQCQLVTPLQLYFNWKAVAVNWQIWRIFTNFFYFGSLSLDFVFHMFFFMRYSRMLEESSFANRKADYVWLLLLSSIILLALSPLVNLPFLSSPLAFVPIYFWSRRHPSTPISLFGLITITAPYLPLALVGLAWILNGTWQAAAGDLLYMAPPLRSSPNSFPPAANEARLSYADGAMTARSYPARTETCRACGELPASGLALPCERCKCVFYCSTECRDDCDDSHAEYCKAARADLPMQPPSGPVAGVRLIGGNIIPYNPEEATVLPSHPVWRMGNVSPLSQLVDMPILIYRERPEAELEVDNIADMDNQAVTYFMVDPETGIAPARWQKNIGEVSSPRQRVSSSLSKLTTRPPHLGHRCARRPTASQHVRPRGLLRLLQQPPRCLHLHSRSP
ncbi:hypothetical protein NM688_g2160 [Phlebia brevispora]|uniref:Uncharacterized protein n=1 Tax=Phlebia brevispora TaxID=194682 RepID=A0ACC1T967_9APHY|nr:hypothetical protein NM688_g2160 [Phlebia brevispora]